MKKQSLAVLLVTLLVPALLFARVEGKFDTTLTVSGPVNLDLTTGSGDVMVKTAVKPGRHSRHSALEQQLVWGQ